jgi:hypothetical protein
MSSAEYGAIGVQNRSRTLFGQVMWSVATTAGLFALGAYLGRNLGNGPAFVFYLLAFLCLIGMRFVIRSSAGLSMTLLLGVGLLMGLGTSPMLTYWTQHRLSPHRSSWTHSTCSSSSCNCSGAGVGTDNHRFREPGRWPRTRIAFIVGCTATVLTRWLIFRAGIRSWHQAIESRMVI